MNTKANEARRREREAAPDSHANVDVKRVVANLASHVHVALAVFLHADVRVGRKMKIIALQRACKNASDHAGGETSDNGSNG